MRKQYDGLRFAPPISPKDAELLERYQAQVSISRSCRRAFLRDKCSAGPMLEEYFRAIALWRLLEETSHGKKAYIGYGEKVLKSPSVAEAMDVLRRKA